MMTTLIFRITNAPNPPLQSPPLRDKTRCYSCVVFNIYGQKNLRPCLVSKSGYSVTPSLFPLPAPPRYSKISLRDKGINLKQDGNNLWKDIVCTRLNEIISSIIV